MQYITTKYFGPGNVRGSRVKATASGGCSVIVGYDGALNSEANHRAAAVAALVAAVWYLAGLLA